MTELDQQQVLETFFAEAAERIRSLEEGLIALETRPGDAEQLAAIFRAAHSLKGDALCVGLDGIAGVAHELEELLELVRRAPAALTRARTEALLEAIDGLRELLAAAESGRDEPAGLQRALAARLRAAGEGAGSAPREPAPIETSPEGEAPFAAQAARSLRVATEKLDRMLNLTGEIAVARAQLQQRLEARQDPLARQLLEELRDADHLHLELQDLVMRARMVPIGPVFRQHLRTVRDLSLSRGRLARLAIEGADVEVDTAVVEQLRDPLLHMIRNAVDHGLESPEERRAAGKDPTGTITLRARHEAGSVVVQVADDGRGLDRGRILEKARAQGLAAESLTERELTELVVTPGFSTAAEVSAVSGRGVGLDVVRQAIEALRGSFGLESAPGEGCTATLRLPLTLAIIEGFRVGVGDSTYVMPMDVVSECLDLPASEQGRAGAEGVLDLRGDVLPYLSLRGVFGHDGAPPTRESVVVVRHGGLSAGLVVDTLQGESQTVIKPLGRFFADVPGIAGSAILGSGRVALILDVPGLLRRALGSHASARPA